MPPVPEDFSTYVQSSQVCVNPGACCLGASAGVGVDSAGEQRKREAGKTITDLALWWQILELRISSNIRYRFIIELFGERHHNALGAAEVAESIHVLVLYHLAHEFSPMFLQAGNDIVDISDSEHDTTDTQRVHRGILWLSPDRFGRVELVQLEPPVAVGGPHRCDVASDAVEPHDTVHPLSLDGGLALKLQTKFGKERDRSLEVVDNEEDIVHSW